MSLLGLDIGTTGCKAVAFSEDGKIIAQAYREYPLLNPRPRFYELDPEVVWRHVTDCLRIVNASAAHDPVKALAISAQGEAVVPLSKDGQVLANSPVSSDSRAVLQSDFLKELLGAQKIYEITGQPASTLFSLPKILWWKDHASTLYNNTWKFLCYGDFALLKLGLDPVIDYTMAARMLCFDIRTLDWSPEILDAAGIEVDRLAKPLPSGSVVGKIPQKTAADLGFETGVQVVLGGHDQPCGALGAGVLRRGEAMYSIGTTEAIAAVIDAPNPMLEAINCPCYPHVVPGTLVALAGNQTGGRLLRWYRDVFGVEEREVARRENRDVYDVIVGQISDQPSRLFVLPHFAGSGSLLNDPDSKGAILGLTFDTRREDIVKAILEGITYEQALTIRQLQAAGVEITSLNAIGGGARSAIWLQMKADIMGAPVAAVQVSEASCLGAALLSGWALGIYPSLDKAVEQVVTESAVYQPNFENSAYYRTQLERYAQIYPTLRVLNL